MTCISMPEFASYRNQHRYSPSRLVGRHHSLDNPDSHHGLDNNLQSPPAVQATVAAEPS